jgi:segregation and condensation protein B
MAELSLSSRLGAVLFVASEPLSLPRLAGATEADEADVAQALTALQVALEPAGLALAEHQGTYRLVTLPAAAAVVRRFLQDESRSELSRPALETLAIVAYRGPITKAGIEAVRGVASDTMVRNLLARGLITEAGKSTEPGHPLQYAVSHAFLQHFGLTSTADLPPLPDAPAGEEAHAY